MSIGPTDLVSTPAGVGDVHAAVDLLAGLDLGSCGHGDLDVLSGAAQRVRGFVAAADARIARRRDELWSSIGPGVGATVDADTDVGQGTYDDDAAAPGAPAGSPDTSMPDTSTFDGLGDRRSGAEMERDRARARAGSAMPSFEAALAAGEIDAAHLDAVTTALARLTGDDDGDAVERFIAHEAELLGHAKNERPERFRRRCTDLARRLSVDHGVRWAERQKRQASIKRWWGRDGMWHLHAHFDAETAAKVEAALDAHFQATRSNDVNSQLSWQRLQVDSFVELITSAAALEVRVPELAVLIDWDTLRTGVFGPHSICESSSGAPLSPAAVRRMACDAGLLPVVLGGDGVPIDLGRRRRLATREQRQALRAMYRTCGHPHCDVPFDRCRIHHIINWLAGGATDLDDLYPLCDQHHHLVHEGGWTLSMTPDRVTTWTTPDRSVWFVGDTRDRPSLRDTNDATVAEGVATLNQDAQAEQGRCSHGERPDGRRTNRTARMGLDVDGSIARRSSGRDHLAPAHPPTLFGHDAEPAGP